MTPRATPWRIRRTQPSDLTAVLQLFDEAVAWLNARGITDQWGTTPVSARPHLVEEVRGFLDFAVVAEVDEEDSGKAQPDRLAGFITVSLTLPEEIAPLFGERTATAVWVESLVARRTPAARGAGADLLRWAEQRALAHGKTYLGLSCAASNPRLVEYYEGRGFERVGEVGEIDGPSALFEKRLELAREPINPFLGGCTAESAAREGT